MVPNLHAVPPWHMGARFTVCLTGTVALANVARVSATAPTILARALRFLGVARATPASLPVAPATAVALTPPSRGDSGRYRVRVGGGGDRVAPQSSNPALYTPAGWSDACDKAATDPKVFAGLEVRADTALNADVRAVLPQGVSDEAAALVNQVMGWDGAAVGSLVRGWPQIHGELMIMADRKGASLGEEVWDVAGGVRVLVDVEQRHLANLESWLRDGRDNIVGVRMRKAKPGRELYDIPLYSAADAAGGGVHIVFGYDGDPEGRLGAVLGSTIDWVALKEHMTKQAWDGVSRWAMPVVKATLRTEIVQRLGLRLDDPDVVQALERAEEAASAFLSGEEAALSDSDLVGFEAFGGVLDLAQWVALANLVDHNSLTAIGTPTLTMGVSAAHGSRSAGETITDMLQRCLSSRLSQFLWQFRRQTIARLVRFNLGPTAPVPLLVHSGLDPEGMAYHIGTVPHLIHAGLIDPRNPEDRRAIRRVMGLNPRTPAPAALPSNPPLGNPGSPGPGRGNEASPDMQPLDVQ